MVHYPADMPVIRFNRKKRLLCLKGAKWTASYEEDLQKVSYEYNLIANLYAMADWFSPADTEAPTLETVQFYDRKSYEPVALQDVPPAFFSEVMRDIDLWLVLLMLAE